MKPEKFSITPLVCPWEGNPSAPENFYVEKVEEKLISEEIIEESDDIDINEIIQEPKSKSEHPCQRY